MSEYILYFLLIGMLIALITKNGKIAAATFGIAFFGVPILGLLESVFNGHKAYQLLVLCIGFLIVGHAIGSNK